MPDARPVPMDLRDPITSSRTTRVKEDDLLHVDAEPLIHGAVRVERDEVGWFRPWRFANQQVRAVSSTMAWRPGLYRQMAAATAGITVEFLTDATLVGLEIQLDPEPQGTADVLAGVDNDRPRRAHDGFSVDADGSHLPATMPDTSASRVMFDLTQAELLPSEVHHVRIWLPWGRGCLLRDIVCDGSFVRPLDARPYLLVLSDSQAQGFVVDDPALTWPALAADELGLDHVNQGLGGQIFQASSLAGLATLPRPAGIVVSLGTNYAYAPFKEKVVEADIRAYLHELSRTFDNVPVYVATPGWLGPRTRIHPKSCIRQVPALIEQLVAKHEGYTLVDGLELMAHNRYLFADAEVHPNAEGASQLADHWIQILSGLRQDVVAEEDLIAAASEGVEAFRAAEQKRAAELAEYERAAKLARLAEGSIETAPEPEAPVPAEPVEEEPAPSVEPEEPAPVTGVPVWLSEANSGPDPLGELVSAAQEVIDAEEAPPAIVSLLAKEFSVEVAPTASMPEASDALEGVEEALEEEAEPEEPGEPEDLDFEALVTVAPPQPTAREYIERVMAEESAEPIVARPAPDTSGISDDAVDEVMADRSLIAPVPTVAPEPEPEPEPDVLDLVAEPDSSEEPEASLGAAADEAEHAFAAEPSEGRTVEVAPQVPASAPAQQATLFELLPPVTPSSAPSFELLQSLPDPAVDPEGSEASDPLLGTEPQEHHPGLSFVDEDEPESPLHFVASSGPDPDEDL